MDLILSFIWFCIWLGTEGKPQFDSENKQCSDLADYGWFCVPFYQCDDESKIIIDGTELIDPRLGDVDCDAVPTKAKATTSKCPKLTKRCCLHPRPTHNCGGIKRTNGGTKRTNGGTKRTNGGTKRTNGVSNCGTRNEDGIVGLRSTLEVGADEAEFGEWPHVCAVLKKKIEQGTELLVYLCGGSLIDEGVILTAAHCLNDITSADLIVRCGEWDTLSEDPLPYQEIGVDTVQNHPCFNNGNLHDDVALLFLQSKFALTSHINPVCMPEPGTEWSGGRRCVSNGWGKDRFGAEGKYANILKEIVIPLVENKECQNLLRENTRLGPFFELDNSFMCAGGLKDIDTCKGDGGSPLSCEQADGSWVQAGIVSWGIGCGGLGVPAMYANVATAACWIDSQIRCYYGDKDTASVVGLRESQCPRVECGQNRSECSK